MTDLECAAPDCKEKAEFSTPEPWCSYHWDEWWDCPCGNEIEGEANCDIHFYMKIPIITPEQLTKIKGNLNAQGI